MQAFRKGDSVWIRYHNGKIYEGRVIRFQKEGESIVTVFTPENGYRTVKASDCALTREDLVSR